MQENIQYIKLRFSKLLLQWHSGINREMPWKLTKDPYKIWLSEIILQQTRVAQGTPYYLRMVARFPTVKDLAQAAEDEVLKHWQGLGYYSRARNLHFAAKTIMEDYDGLFPVEYHDILSLKGVGRYTAAAIASFAYDLPYPVVDGNVKRVIARVAGITDAVDKRETEKEIYELAAALIDDRRPADYNQAIMDFGALICTPQNPKCDGCVLQSICIAYEEGLTDVIPIKSMVTAKQKVNMHFIVLYDDDNIYMKKRDYASIWKGLYQPILLDYAKATSLTKSHIADYTYKTFGLKPNEISKSKPYKHILSHRVIKANFYYAKVVIGELEDQKNIYNMQELRQLPIPKLVENALMDKGIL